MTFNDERFYENYGYDPPERYHDDDAEADESEDDDDET